MTFEWQLTTLGSVTDWSSGGTPKKDEPRFWGGDIPWISANSMHSSRCFDSDLKLTIEGLKGSRLAPSDAVLLLVRGSALHNRLPVCIATRAVAFNQDVKAITAKSQFLRPWYLLYWLMGNERFLLDSVVEDTGIGAGKLDTKRMQALEFFLPPLKVQDEIIEVAKAIDDRITLLRENNQTLEAIAQALFKSWFVDFDPVRAKVEGKLPEGMDAATAALFPDALEETELGLVPRGWSVKCLSAFIAESTRRIGDVPAIVLSAVQTGNLVMSSDFFNKRVHSKDISKYKAVEPYSYAYNPSRINIGSIGINEMGVVGAVSPIYVVANPKNISFGYYLWHLLRTNRIRESIKTMSSGTVRQSLAFKDFASIKVALPADEIVNQFFEVRDEIFKNINLKENQISVLSNLRDTLLPRLISGQLRIADAEAELDKAVA